MTSFEHLPNITEQQTFGAPKFTTSADVVMQASGLRLEAIRTIAREQGVKIEDTACRCIDESLLASLADAHIRRLRAYFHKAQRHIAELAGDELATFVEFCKTYQKRQTSNPSSLLWSEIDHEAIREQFLNKVHRLTLPEKRCCFFSSIQLNEIIFESRSLESVDIRNLLEGLSQEDIIDKIIQSYLYHEKSCLLVNYTLDLRSEVRKTILSARYHIFVSEDEDHQNDVASKYSLLTNAPKMVV